MAAPNLGQIVANAWEAHVGTTPEDNIHNDYWLFNRLSEGKAFEQVDGGRSINGPIEYALNTTFRSYSDTEPIDTTRIDVFDEFTFPWREYAGTVVLSELEKAKNQGEGRKFNLQEGKLENLKNSAHNILNAAMYGDGTGNNNKDLQGLALLVSATPTSGSPGGINRATFTFWRNLQTSGAQSVTAFDNLRSSMRSSYNSASAGVDEQHPEYAVTDQTTLQGYEAILLANERITDKTKSQANAGFKNSWFMFKDIPVAYDRACTVGAMYLLNYSNLKLAYQKGYWLKGFPAVDPANQTIEVFKVMCIANLYTNNPRRLAVITAIT
jgi:hypothetical protein